MVYWWWDRKTWGALRAADWRGIHQRKNHRFQPCLHPSLLETLAKKHASLSPKKLCVFYHPNAGCLLDQWHGIFKLYYHMLPVFFPGFPEIPAFWGRIQWWQRCFRRWGRTVLCFASIRPCHSTRRWRIWKPLQDGMLGVGHGMGWSPETLGERSDGYDICASCINQLV